MRRSIAFVLVLALFVPLAAFATHTHFAWLNGHQETPPVTTAGEGCGTLELIGSDLHYDLRWSGLSSGVTAAHIHTGNVGVPGGVAHPLQNLTQTSARGVWTGLTAAQIASLNAHGLYVNVHTVNHGGGEIRGQILLDGTKIAVLDGAQETPPVATPGLGFGWFLLDGAQTSLSYAVAWGNLLAPGTVTGGHIHLGVAGTPGGVVHPLMNLTNVAANGAWALSAQNVIQLEAESLYVNIHTTNHGGGEIRGQIFCPCIPENANFDASAIGESQCILLCPDKSSRIRVFNVPDGQYPTIIKRLGCQDPCNLDCDPTTYIQEIFSVWQITNGVFWLELRGDGCLCVTLDGILAVELASFSAIAGDGRVDLVWTTASESDNDYFEVLRDGERVAQVGATNSATGHTYNWSDLSVDNGRAYAYTLYAVDLAGVRSELATEVAAPSTNAASITEYALHQNYPNPFNPETQIVFDLVESGYAELTVYNTVGQTVATLVNGQMNAGRHTAHFEAAALPSGLYFYRLEAGDFSAIRKMVLMK